ncbi:MAG TPA: hypothetical protein VM367_16400 [Pseudonocardia sp.]|nr:hypothetical protein [Pseudonocardia sp.]
MPAVRFSRRWLLVGAGAAGLVAAGALPPAPADARADPERLRSRILGEVPPHTGYAVSTGRLGLPELPQLETATALLTGSTRIRSYVAGPGRRRSDELTVAGERGAYVLDGVEYVWDFHADQLTRVTGSAPARLPRAGDLLPPDLARRLLGLGRTDPVTALPARRIAGRDAAGLRLSPADPATTVGRVDVWADPGTALPLRVEVAARGGPTLLETAFVKVDDGPPDPAVLVPPAPPGAGTVTASAADLAGVLQVLDAPPPPDRLAGRPRIAVPADDALPGVAFYGSGLAAFALVPTSRAIAEQAVAGAALAGGVTVDVGRGRAARVVTPLVSVAVRTRRRGGALLVGAVAPEVLERGLRELSGRPT